MRAQALRASSERALARGFHRPESPAQSPRARSTGFTLVEMLIAMALTLIMVYAIAEFYAYVGDTVRDGRATIEMGGQLRAASARLKSDLSAVTVRAVPWADDGAAGGYLEIVEGSAWDGDAFDDSNSDGIYDLTAANVTTLMGDYDDIIAMTIHSDNEPFTGRRWNTSSNQYETITSRLAEVIWFTGFSDLDNDGYWDSGTNDADGDGVIDAPEPRVLYRRHFLIRPDLANLGVPTGEAGETFHHHNDLSARYSSGWVGNSLADLSRRENRFGHQTGSLPNSMLIPVNKTTPMPTTAPLTRLVAADSGSLAAYTLQNTTQADHTGEDVVFSNLLAFDIRVFDTKAPMREDSTNTVAVGPSDIGFESANTAAIGNGAYVDLNYNSYLTTAQTSDFSGTVDTKSTLTVPTYDTWSISYETRSPGNGNATNGLDDDSANGVDDPDERVTAPPYSVALRGVQVKIRVYDPSSRQVRQATVVGDFVDE